MKALTILSMLLAGTQCLAADAEQLNQRCAPCHGQYGQGASGANAPRLAGLPAWYLSKATRDYTKGARKNPLMVEVAGLGDMSDREVDALSTWLSEQPVGDDPAYDIKTATGDPLAGRRKFEADCADCHGRDGYGNRNKDAPPLAGQHPDYLLSSVDSFYHKDRHHDNDPIDDTFDDISDAQLRDLLSWLSGQDDKRRGDGAPFEPATMPSSVPVSAGYRVASVQQTILSTKTDEGVTAPQAITAMLAKAAELGTPVIPAPPEGEELPIALDLRFCEPRHISRLIAAAPEMAVYDPCRVTVLRQPDLPVRLMCLNLEMLIDGKSLPVEAQRMAILINQDMLAIIRAGKAGSGVAGR